MGEFIDTLKSESLGPDTNDVRLLARLRYRTTAGLLLIVPEGFVCDLASVPKILRSFAMDWRRTGRSGTIHDCAYKWEESWGFTRRQADSIYYECLLADGAWKWRASLQWAGIRAGGWRAWNRHRATDVADKGVEPGMVFTNHT